MWPVFRLPCLRGAGPPWLSLTCSPPSPGCAPSRPAPTPPSLLVHLRNNHLPANHCQERCRAAPSGSSQAADEDEGPGQRHGEGRGEKLGGSHFWTSCHHYFRCKSASHLTHILPLFFRQVGFVLSVQTLTMDQALDERRLKLTVDGGGIVVAAGDSPASLFVFK